MLISSFLSSSGPGRSTRLRPLSSSSIIALVGGRAYLCARFSLDIVKLSGGGGSEAGSKVQESVKEAINPIGAERSHSNGNNNGETEENILARMEDKPTLIINIPSQDQTMGTNPTNNYDVNENKGLLNFIDTFTRTVLVYYFSLLTFSVTFPGSQKALVSYEDTWTKVICYINFISCILGGPLVSFAGHFKGSKSIGHIGFDIFIWALFLWWLFFIIDCGIILHVYLHIPNTIVWPVGLAVFFLTSLPSVVYIEYQRLTIVGKWAKGVWKKIMDFCQNPAIGLYKANIA